MKKNQNVTSLDALERNCGSVENKLKNLLCLFSELSKSHQFETFDWSRIDAHLTKELLRLSSNHFTTAFGSKGSNIPCPRCRAEGAVKELFGFVLPWFRNRSEIVICDDDNLERRGYALAMARKEPFISLKLDTKEPMEIGAFVGAFTSLANEYERYIKQSHP